MIIGAPKKLEDIPVLSQPEIEDLLRQTNEIFSQNLPLEGAMVPLPLGSMLQVVRTLRDSIAVLKEIEALRTSTEELNIPLVGDEPASILRRDLIRIAALAKDILDAEPPAPPPRVQQAKGTLVGG